ncbi:hypothetical protein COMA2_80054 [Candidatus Nitrospira nitrificans]|uniref:Uncharacterized protein n=1 Tax=Candidatus Nitrospira nitrificans TaxID=1742973 RepID=A0A0S4LSN2_9BACT|nr:hypothetical protein COMA2_80054 [Candidatus Nitrospira nitrificans]
MEFMIILMLTHADHVIRAGFAYLSTGQTGCNALLLFFGQRAIIMMHKWPPVSGPWEI